MSKIHAVNVRAMAEFSLEKGDLLPAAQAIERMNDGARIHRFLQKRLDASWNAEEFVVREECVQDMCLRIQGRADAVKRDGNFLHVLEIKSTSGAVHLIGENDNPAYRAQAELYAYLICANEGLSGAEVILQYFGTDGRERRYVWQYDFDELRATFVQIAEPYVLWLKMLEAYESESLPTLQNMKFPFEHYRDGQREMAKYVFRAMGGGKALIEAPTGIGKTAAALFGALKALGAGRVTAIFYLTARTTGRRAAEQALERMRAQGLRLRSISITAKEKCCLMQQVDCFSCPYAIGYYDRRRDALKEALQMEAADAERIRELAQEYHLCPYELSLDMSEQADVIICDYNYAFDPRVHLRRYFDQKSKAGLLIDEVHNLPDRARDMLTAELSGQRIAEVRRLIGRYEGRESPAYLALTELLKAFTNRSIEEPEAPSELPQALLEAVQYFVKCAQDLQSPEPKFGKLLLEAFWFVRTAKQFDETCYRVLLLPQEKRLTVRLWRYNPSEYLKSAFDRVGGAAMFSATLAPMDHYAGQLGMNPNGGDALVRLESPFPKENLLTVRLPVSVRFQDRERTMHEVVSVLHAMAHAHQGNYLACFPSFAYLTAAFEHYRLCYPEDHAVRQQNAMPEAARAAFIEHFQDKPERSMLAFIVLGGVFAEGVDLPEEKLSGAAIVSTGMPQIGFERDLLRELYDDGFEGGYDVAYVYPGIRRVLQAAGRVIRTERDRGVVLLLDARYAEEKILALLPEHWQLRVAKNMSGLKSKLHEFWNTKIVENVT